MLDYTTKSKQHSFEIWWLFEYRCIFFSLSRFLYQTFAICLKRCFSTFWYLAETNMVFYCSLSLLLDKTIQVYLRVERHGIIRINPSNTNRSSHSKEKKLTYVKPIKNNTFWNQLVINKQGSDYSFYFIKVQKILINYIS